VVTQISSIRLKLVHTNELGIGYHSSRLTLLPVRVAASRLGIGYSTLKQWIYAGRVRTIETAGGHHRIPEAGSIASRPSRRRSGEARSRHLDERQSPCSVMQTACAAALKKCGLTDWSGRLACSSAISD
jgi:excisionase family DNA binding protein